MDHPNYSREPSIPAAAGLLVSLPGMLLLAALLCAYARVAPSGALLNSTVALTALFIVAVFSLVSPFGQAAHLIVAPRSMVRHNATFLAASAALCIVALLTAALLELLYAVFADTPPSSLLRFAVPVVAAAIAVPTTRFISSSLSASDGTAIRGRTLLGDRAVDARINALRKARSQEHRAPVPDYFWGGKLIPASVFVPDPHFLLIGTAGSGKTALLKALMRSVLSQRGLGFDSRAVVYDPKLELYPYLLSLGIPREDILILNPFDARAHPWDIAADVHTHADAKQLAATLIPLDPKESDPYFTNASRTILEAAIVTFMERKRPWDLRDLIEVMAKPSRLESFLSTSEAGRRAVEIQLKQAEKTASNILSNLHTALSPISTAAYLWHRAKLRGAEPVTVGGWMQSKHQVLLLTMNADASESLRRLYCTIFRRVVDYLLKRGENLPDHSWLFFDEARDLQFMDGLEDLLQKGRSKSTHLVLGFQDVPAAKATYDEHRALSILAACQNIAALRVEGRETAEYLAGRFGNHEFWKTSFGTSANPQGGESASLSTHVDERKSVLPDEFMALPSTQVAAGIPGLFATPAIGAWGPTVVPFSSLDAPPVVPLDPQHARRDGGFVPVEAADHAPLYWSDDEELAFLTPDPPTSGGASLRRPAP